MTTDEMTPDEMYDAQREFYAWDVARERAAISAAEAVPPEGRTRAQWAVLGWLHGPPLYARQDEPEVDHR